MQNNASSIVYSIVYIMVVLSESFSGLYVRVGTTFHQIEFMSILIQLIK
jgi:hypothetical protein